MLSVCWLKARPVAVAHARVDAVVENPLNRLIGARIAHAAAQCGTPARLLVCTSGGDARCACVNVATPPARRRGRSQQSKLLCPYQFGFQITMAPQLMVGFIVGGAI